MFYLGSLLLVSLITGDLFVKFILQDRVPFSNLITKFLLGIFCINICIFLLSIISPFGLSINWYALILIFSVLWVGSGWKQRGNILLIGDISEIIFFLIIPIAVTGWCQDLLRPIEITNGMGIIRAWPDIYYHLAQINSFASSSGGSTISDVQMAGAPAHLYHMASYALPATMVAITGISSLEAYSSLYIPLGVLLTALAAFSLINSTFGKWPALASSLALLLLPDAFQQGFGNPFLSYHWMQQIGPAGLYGVTVAAIAFIFLFESCRFTNYKYILIGYFFVGISILYKAQIFVAISFVALIYPILFSEMKKKYVRIIFLLVLSVFFLSIVKISQKLPNIPALRLDGSGFSDFVSIIFGLQLDGLMRSLVSPFLSTPFIINIFTISVFSALLIICTLGVYIFIYISVLKRIKQSIKPYIWFYPLIVLLVYLIMATSLAMDDRHVGSPEELLHRPFVWAYFIFITWGIAGGYYFIWGDNPPSNSLSKLLFIFLTIGLLAVPVRFGQGISTIMAHGMNYQELPLCQLRAANFIKNNSNKFDVILDSNNDPKFLMTSLSERPIFVMDAGGYREPFGVKVRLNVSSNIRISEELNEVKSIMHNNSIKWYVVNPRTDIKWQLFANELRVFECGGYSVYKFN